MKYSNKISKFERDKGKDIAKLVQCYKVAYSCGNNVEILYFTLTIFSTCAFDVYRHSFSR